MMMEDIDEYSLVEIIFVVTQETTIYCRMKKKSISYNCDTLVQKKQKHFSIGNVIINCR